MIRRRFLVQKEYLQFKTILMRPFCQKIQKIEGRLLYFFCSETNEIVVGGRLGHLQQS